MIITFLIQVQKHHMMNYNNKVHLHVYISDILQAGSFILMTDMLNHCGFKSYLLILYSTHRSLDFDYPALTDLEKIQKLLQKL
jgi:hypothetical protein